MLDQNTDRMWYVIGAIIIGAAIIFILNGTMPELFASVGGTFEDKTKETTAIVDGIMPNVRDESLIGPGDVTLAYSEVVSYDEATHTWDLIVEESGEWQANGLRMNYGPFEVPYGSTLRLSYEIYIPEELNGIYAENDINNHPVAGYNMGWRGNDNDEIEMRQHNGQYTNRLKTPLEPGKWTSVWFSYSNSSAANIEQEPIFDTSRFGVTNNTGEPMRVKIRNVRLTIR